MTLFSAFHFIDHLKYNNLHLKYNKLNQNALLIPDKTLNK